jgi:multidrug efflux pump subunit AcrA (membrane-fusion protein)
MIMAAALITLFLPIKVYYSFKATAMIYPLKEWYLNRGQEDSYITEMQSYETNALSHIKSFKFERGDISEVLIDDSLVSGTRVKAGDTIAYIHSFFISNEIVRLENLKNVAEENLASSLVGAKPATIDEAQQQYNFAQQQLELEKKNYERNLKLVQDSIISQAEFDLAENSYQLATINVEIAYNQLLDANTGVKEEDVNVIRQQIDSYERELKVLSELRDQYYVTSPIDGIINYNQVLNSILSISDTTKYILKIPVKVNNVQYLDRITGIRFSIPGYTEKINASFLDLDDNVSLFPDQQFVMAKALIPGGQFKILPGMVVQCSVFCDRITLLAFLRRSIKLHL